VRVLCDDENLKMTSLEAIFKYHQMGSIFLIFISKNNGGQ